MVVGFHVAVQNPIGVHDVERRAQLHVDTHLEILALECVPRANMRMLKPATVHFAGDPGPTTDVLPDLRNVPIFPTYTILPVGTRWGWRAQHQRGRPRPKDQ